MATMIKSMRGSLVEPKFLIPLAVFLWLLVALPLVLFIQPSGAAATTGTDCANLTSSNWQTGFSSSQKRRLKLVNNDSSNACFSVGGLLTGIEGYYDGDYDTYVYTPNPENLPGWESKFLPQLQWYDQCQWSYKATNGQQPKCNFLAEISPIDSGAKRSRLTSAPGYPERPYCIDEDHSGNGIRSVTGDKCAGKAYKVKFVGTLAWDTNHWTAGANDWLELHSTVTEYICPAEPNNLYTDDCDSTKAVYTARGKIRR